MVELISSDIFIKWSSIHQGHIGERGKKLLSF